MTTDPKDTFNTFAGRAAVDAAAERGGRWAASGEVTVLRTLPNGAPRYPTQPTSSPWARDPVGPEPPLGFDINALPALGGASPVIIPEGKSRPSDVEATPVSPAGPSIRRRLR